jgi:diguanylate cyclase (GGDEF)-like protein
VLISDVTDNVMLINRLEEEAHTDELTGLFNRRHFIGLAADAMESCREEGKPCCVIMFDLDFFKRVNDNYGHTAGDEILRMTAQVIHKAVRSSDILARYGGEEFVVFMSTDADIAGKLAERIRENVAAMICHFEGEEIRVTCSLGVAEVDEDYCLETLIDFADAALYTAKQRGRNRVCFARNAAGEIMTGLAHNAGHNVEH